MPLGSNRRQRRRRAVVVGGAAVAAKKHYDAKQTPPEPGAAPEQVAPAEPAAAGGRADTPKAGGLAGAMGIAIVGAVDERRRADRGPADPVARQARRRGCGGRAGELVRAGRPA